MAERAPTHAAGALDVGARGHTCSPRPHAARPAVEVAPHGCAPEPGTMLSRPTAHGAGGAARRRASPTARGRLEPRLARPALALATGGPALLPRAASVVPPGPPSSLDLEGPESQAYAPNIPKWDVPVPP